MSPFVSVRRRRVSIRKQIVMLFNLAESCKSSFFKKISCATQTRHVYGFSMSVSQEHPMGCAVACIAERCGISYSKALALLPSADLAWTRGIYCEELVSALGLGGFIYCSEEYDERLHNHLLKREGTIVFVKECERYRYGHFVVCTKNGWMNPWINCPQMIPVVSGYESNLPGEVQYIVFETTERSDQ